MSKNNLLTICHSYNNFQKDSIESISNYFRNVSVMVRCNPVSEIAKYIPIPYLNRFRLDYKIDLTNKSSNIEVRPTPLLYAPFDFQYKNLGEIHYNKIEKIIKSQGIKFDLIHSHFVWSSGYVGARLKEKYQTPLIITAYGYDIYDLPFRDNVWKEKIENVLNTADCIITVSNSNLKCIKKLNISTSVKMIPNGFNQNLFFPRDILKSRTLLKLPINKRIILSVGHLVDEKGHRYLIEAMRKVVNHRNDTMCIIVGSGELISKLQRQIKNLNLESYVKLVGGKPHDEIPLWMNACDVFVLPSLKESFGVVQIEAMGCGKPVVATRNKGSEEIIVSEKIGYLVEPKNPEDLAEKILLSLDKEWDKKFVLDYAEKFKFETISNKLFNVFKLVN